MPVAASTTKRSLSWQDKLNGIIREHWTKHANKDKQVGHETMDMRREVIFLCFSQLHSLGYKLEEPLNLQGRHVKALVNYWESKDMSPSTIQIRLSILRRFSEWIGKKGMILGTENYVSSPEKSRRSYSAKVDKSWSGKKIDFNQIFEQVRKEDRHVAIQLRLMLAFGLRRKEAIMFRPFRAHIGNTIALDAQSGTKGGKARIIPIENEMQKTVLADAKAIAKVPTGHVGHPQLTLEQSIKRFENILAKCGITKETMGVTSHGLRHQFLNDYYERIAGAPSPVRNLEQSGNADSSLVGLAKVLTSAVAGHVRPGITSAYTGSAASLKKAKNSESRQPGLFDEPV